MRGRSMRRRLLPLTDSGARTFCKSPAYFQAHQEIGNGKTEAVKRPF